ncbi:MAG: hypothetical protein RLZ35_327 [Pseudomonadota bacterium]|jgi:uncharacterized protein YbcC (UPF0753/DUF2309 family)
MKHATHYESERTNHGPEYNYIRNLVKESFKTIAPMWPLKHLIAVNPLQGFEDLTFEQAIHHSSAYFEQQDIPAPIQAINRETMKWLQVYCDEGQATLGMPKTTEGLYPSWKMLVVYDKNLHQQDKQKKYVLQQLPQTAEQTIAESLLYLGISKDEHLLFLTLMLTTLPGWSSYIKYRSEWAYSHINYPNPVTQSDYLAIRLVITRLLWPNAKELLYKHNNILNKKSGKNSILDRLYTNEERYRIPLLKKIAIQPLKKSRIPSAQLVFCIDVRSEPLRKQIESSGDYQTFGFAGFFGIPVEITNPFTQEAYTACPVLLSPSHQIKGTIEKNTESLKAIKGYKQFKYVKQLYQSLKYTFTTPFALVESLGIMIGAWLGLRSIAPQVAYKIKHLATKKLLAHQTFDLNIDNIPFSDQCNYAENALRMIGLTKHFAPLVVFCGHGSTTQNNGYATALDCGACGGQQGGNNAKLLVAILNRATVRSALAQRGILIPSKTRFIAGAHNTTTDKVTLYDDLSSDDIRRLQQHLEAAGHQNSVFRLQHMDGNKPSIPAHKHVFMRAQDWAQIRPEWGLARNAAFIVGPRDITASLSLEGRCFLHSYDYEQDNDGKLLTAILTAPMIVAQWINAQYLFSTLNNVAYGGGSKVTANITGKIGIMQGNGSDLMTGLPLQSVYKNDTEAYHEPQRLMTVVFSPLKRLEHIIHTQAILKQLVGNDWIKIACIEPETRHIYLLKSDFYWDQVR